MGNNCIDKDCQFSCCDIDGYCPVNQLDCHYGHNSNAGITAAIVIGAVLGIIIIAVLGFCCYSRYRQNREKEEEGEEGQ